MDHKKYLRTIGANGGKARASKLTAEQLREIAMKGVDARAKKKEMAQVVDAPSALQKFD